MMNEFLIYFIVFIFAVVVGSFLNVVIYRLPIMLKQQWRLECLEFLNQNSAKENIKKFNLMIPRSHCIQCKNKISWWQNIPLISYFLLQARCSICSMKIAFRYPFVEFLTGVFCCFLVFHYGLNLTALLAIIFTLYLIVIIFIDFDHLLLPDQLTLSLLWIGLLINCIPLFTSTINSIIGAASGYLALWLIMHVYRVVTGKTGMGHGDFKLLAAIGAWFGWEILPLTVCIAAFIGALVGIILIFLKKSHSQTPLAFGPYLAIGAWIAMIWSPEIFGWYIHLIG